LNFWVEGQVRVGTGSSDTWLRMLQEIQLVTEPVARGIINNYPTVKSLYDAYKKCLTREEAESLLTFVEVILSFSCWFYVINLMYLLLLLFT
jgi:hypothetical protein